MRPVKGGVYLDSVEDAGISLEMRALFREFMLAPLWNVPACGADEYRVFPIEACFN
jgi:hypothetical protein